MVLQTLKSDFNIKIGQFEPIESYRDRGFDSVTNNRINFNRKSLHSDRSLEP